MRTYKYFQKTCDIVSSAKPLEPLVYPAFVLGNLTLVIGDSGTCKSTLIAGMCNAIARGEEFLDFVPIINPIKAVIFDLESSGPLIRERYLEVLQEQPAAEIWTCNEPVTWKEAQDELMKLVRDEDINLIFLDHLFLAFPQDDMSSASEALKIMAEQRAFARTFNVCVVSLLHPPIESRGGIRKGFGSIYKTNSVDIQINLTPDEKLQDIVELEIVKDRCYNQHLHFKFRKEGGKFIKVEDLTHLHAQYYNKKEACREAILQLTNSEENTTSYYLSHLGQMFKENMIKVELSHLAVEGKICRVRYGIYKAASKEPDNGQEA